MQQQHIHQYPAAATGSSQQPSRHRCQFRLSTGKGLVPTRLIHRCQLAVLGWYGLRLRQHAYHQDHQFSEPTSAGSRSSSPSSDSSSIGQQPRRQRSYSAVPFLKGLVCTRCFQSLASALPDSYGLRLVQAARHHCHHSAEPSSLGSRSSRSVPKRLYMAARADLLLGQALNGDIR